MELILWYDLTSMRPDEYAAMNAFRWQEAVVLRTAFEDGRADAHRERDTRDKLTHKVTEMQA